MFSSFKISLFDDHETGALFRNTNQLQFICILI